ncbi:unnamed protein product [Orchesella dallaii]|uniref:Uncharacterized protein n=1 Tax=Orchesella dallaii TaxID=48710 RepID=A0ABP1RN80_9HEXA
MSVRSYGFCKLTILELEFILFISLQVPEDGGELTSNQIDSKGTKDHADMEMVDSKFDFNFKWDEEPPKVISQLDLEMTWDDETNATPSKVSIYNITTDHDITGPLTQLITTVANSSFHDMNRHKKLTSGEAETSNNVLKGERGQRGRRGRKGMQGDKGEPGLSIVGPKGEPGDSGLLPHHLLYPKSDSSSQKGEPGPRGPPGPPGSCPMRMYYLRHITHEVMRVQKHGWHTSTLGT